MNYLRKRVKGLSLRSLTVALLLLAVIVATAAGVGRAAPLSQTGSAMAVAAYDQINIRSGPSTAFVTVGNLALNQSCPIIGRDTSTGWWLIRCQNGVTGWVSPDVVTVVGDTSGVPSYTVGGSAIVASPEPQAPSQPTTFSGWQASYFANADLAGAPVLVQDAPEINFDWGNGSPSPNVPVDNFSARYIRTLNLPAGNYLLTLRMDDGARVFIDNQLVMNDWRVGSQRELQQTIPLNGNHTFTVEYFEGTGVASLFFAITPLSSAPTPTPPPPPPPYQPSVPTLSVPQDQWRAQFYNNTGLGGSPAAAMYLPRSAYQLDQNWGAGAPTAGVNADYFSAVFEGNFYFAAGDYIFTAQMDDGARVYIDNILIIDAWNDGPKERSNRFNSIGVGYHNMRVEFYEQTGNAYVRVWWALAGSTSPTPTPTPGGGGNVPPPPGPIAPM
jgi:uncharacterized protein YraI